MKKNQIKQGSLYIAKISGREVTVRVDRIYQRSGYNGALETRYDVTNLKTKRQTTFRSAAKFRGEAQTPEQRLAAAIRAAEMMGAEARKMIEQGNVTRARATAARGAHWANLVIRLQGTHRCQCQ